MKWRKFFQGIPKRRSFTIAAPEDQIPQLMEEPSRKLYWLKMTICLMKCWIGCRVNCKTWRQFCLEGNHGICFFYFSQIIMKCTRHSGLDFFRMMDEYRAMAKFLQTVDCFLMNEYNFITENTEKLYRKLGQVDQKLFNFDIHSLDWDAYMQCYNEGVRRHILQ